MYQGQQQSRIIDGEEYKSQPHYGERNLYFFAQFVKLFTEPLANLILGFVDSGADTLNVDSIMDADLDWKAIAHGIINLSDKLSPQEYVDLVKGFLAETQYKNKSVSESFNSLFAGRMLLVHKLLAFALEVNFADFLSLAKDRMNKEESKEKESQ
jgi:hypothetical protein